MFSRIRKTMARASGKINWSIHLVDFLIVTLGILIGFGLNNWNETRKEKNQVDLYISGIKEELILNKGVLEEVHPYHKELLKELEENPLQANLVLSPGDVSNAAWRLSENTIFKKHVDPVLYKKLSQVYQLHSGLIKESVQAGKLMNESNVLGMYYLTNLIDVEITEEEEKELAIRFKEGWIPVFETWTSIEEDYLKYIDEAVKLLEEKGH